MFSHCMKIMFILQISSSISGELIQLDPAEICFPALLNKAMLFTVNVINITDFYVAFNAYWMERIAPRNRRSFETGILPPRSTTKHSSSWILVETELEAMEPSEELFMWNRVVTEGVEREDIISYMVEEESKKFHGMILPKEATPCTSNELIQFDPPELSLPFMPNKPLVFSVNIINNTDYCVGFVRYHPETNAGVYDTVPASGVMPPRSTQRLIVRREPEKDEPHDMQCEDKFFLWSSLAHESAEASNIHEYVDYEGSMELPIVYNKTSLCASDELIQFDPPELPFPFLSNKRVSMLHLSKGMFKIANVTDHIVGFSIWSHEDNYARYKMEPEEGILPPQSTQTIMVRRILNGNQTEDLQCKDKIFVWNGIVTEGVEVSDVGKYWKGKDKELPVVLTMTTNNYGLPIYVDSLEKAVQGSISMVETLGRKGLREGSHSRTTFHNFLRAIMILLIHTHGCHEFHIVSAGPKLTYVY
ncbi:hypothetical protein QYE76_048502 [Lolium multiflorum]|uniref:MSP domain-containing protein n=1 Tax=Lolium multiflorum TaxID=4521 RepID=A0AAD8SL57_LOLMU|nr:hypothetical protein QYE76_048502 [Lolium multiflorum]